MSGVLQPEVILPGKPDEERQSTKLNFNLKPMIVLMTICGCYHIHCNNKGVNISYWTYRVILVLIVSIYAIRGIAMFTDESQVFSHISLVLLCVLCLGNCVISWKIFGTKYGHYHQAIADLDQIVSTAIENNIEFDVVNYRRKSIFIVVKAISLTAGVLIVQTVAFFILSPSKDELQLRLNSSISFTTPFEDTLGTRVALFIPLVILALPFFIPTSFLILISTLLLTILKGLNKRIEMSSKDNKSTFVAYLVTLRHIHIRLCAVISALDKDLGFLYANIFIWSIGIGLVVLYLLLKFSQNSTSLFILLYYFSLTIFILGTVSISAALVNAEAHAPLDVIYYVDVKDATLDQVTQLNLFLSKLTGTQVGFTTCGLLTITKEFILTILGVFLTYFAVLYTL